MECITKMNSGEPEGTGLDQDSMVDKNFVSTIGFDVKLSEAELCETYGYELAMSPAETIALDEESSWASEGSGESRMNALKDVADVDNFDLLDPGKMCSDNFDLLETYLFCLEKPMKTQNCVTEHPSGHQYTRPTSNQQLSMSSHLENEDSPNNELAHTSDSSHADQQVSSEQSFAETTALVQGLLRKMTLGQKMKFYAWFNSGLSIQEAAVKSQIPDLIPPPVRHPNCNLSKERLKRLSRILPNVFLQRQFVYEAYFAGLNPKEIMRNQLMSLGLEELMDEFERQLLSEQLAQQDRLLRRKRLAAACSSSATPANDEPAPQEQDHPILEDGPRSLDDPKSEIDPKEGIVKLKGTELKKYYYWRNQGLTIRQAASDAKRPEQNPEIVAHPDCKHLWGKLLRAAHTLPDRVSRELFLLESYFNGKNPVEVLRTLSSGNNSRPSESTNIVEDGTDKLLLEGAPQSQSTTTLAKILMPSQSENAERIQNTVTLVDAGVPFQVLDQCNDQLQKSNNSTRNTSRRDCSPSGSKDLSEKCENPSCETVLEREGVVPVVEISSDDEVAELPKMSLAVLKKYYKWCNLGLSHSEALTKAVKPELLPEAHFPHPSCKYSWEEVNTMSSLVPQKHYRHKFQIEVYYGGKRPVDAMKNILPDIDLEGSSSQTPVSQSAHGHNDEENIRGGKSPAETSVAVLNSPQKMSQIAPGKNSGKAKVLSYCDPPKESTKFSSTGQSKLDQYNDLRLRCREAFDMAKITGLIPANDRRGPVTLVTDNAAKTRVSPLHGSSDDEKIAEISKMGYDERKEYYRWRSEGYNHSDALEKAVAPTYIPHFRSSHSLGAMKTTSSVVPREQNGNKLKNELYYKENEIGDTIKNVQLDNIDGRSFPNSSFNQSTMQTCVEKHQNAASQDDVFDEEAKLSTLGLNQLEMYRKWRNLRFREDVDQTKSAESLPDTDPPCPDSKHFWYNSKKLPPFRFQNENISGKKDPPERMTHDNIMFPDANYISSVYQPDIPTNSDVEQINFRGMNELTESQAETISSMNSHMLMKYYAWRNSGLSYDDAISKIKGKLVLTTREWNELYTPHPNVQYPMEVVEKMASGLPEKSLREQFFIHVWYGGMDPTYALKLVGSYLLPGQKQSSSHQIRQPRNVRIDYQEGKRFTPEDALTRMTAHSGELINEQEKIVRVGRINNRERGSNSPSLFGDQNSLESNSCLEVPQEHSENPWLWLKAHQDGHISAPDVIFSGLNCPGPVSSPQAPAPAVIYPSYPKPAHSPPTEQQFLLHHVEDDVLHRTEVDQSSAENHQPEDNSLECFIVPADYPNVCLSEPQMDAIGENILEAILEIDDEVTKPSFKSSFRRNGRCGFVCNDEFSIEWLYKYLANYQPWEGASLKLITNRFSKSKAVVKLPPCKSDDIKKIMKFIEKQNRSLNVHQWTVLRRLDVGNTLIDVLIDDESASVLKMCSRISFKLGSAEIFIDEIGGLHSTDLHTGATAVCGKKQSSPVSLPQLPPSPRPSALSPPTLPPPPLLSSPVRPTSKRTGPIDTSLGALLKKSAANLGVRDSSKKHCDSSGIRTSAVNGRKRRARRDRSSSGECKRSKSTSQESLDYSSGKIHRRRRSKNYRRRSASPSASRDRAFKVGYPQAHPRKIPTFYRRRYTEHPYEDSHSWLDWYYPNYECPPYASLRKSELDQSFPLSTRFERAGSIENNEYEPYLGKS